MSLKFDSETPMAIVALMVCLPVGSALAYIIAYSFADLAVSATDLFRHPADHRFAIAMIAFYMIAGLRIALTKPQASDLTEDR